MLHDIVQVRQYTNILGDVIKHSVARLLVIQPMANEDTRRRGVELATLQHSMAVPCAILERAVVHLSTGISALTEKY